MRTDDSTEKQSSSMDPELKKLEAIHDRHQEEIWRTKVDSFENLRRSFSQKRSEILSFELREKIRATIREDQSQDLRA
ncbi:hypothetical protein, partial [Rhizobium mongolense]